MADKGRTAIVRFIAIYAIVGGAAALLAPNSMAKLGRWFADNPRYMRLAGLADIGLGLLLIQPWCRAKDPPRPWWRRYF
jgi:hypothetical protein